ncbi:hypothetical protein ACFQ1L_09385 [Phytohabitans flavus]|uniref:hypothetical protein n=1 Tax=Phytohabitans flavus TaxID=1076124 RepID=UPI0036373B79
MSAPVPDVSAVLERAASGESFAAIRRSLTPPGWSTVLARAAVAERFDAELYTGTLAGEAAPDLDVLVEIGLVESVPGRPGWYQLAPEDRAIWSAELPEDERIGLTSRLAEEHLRRGDDLEALRHLVLADPRRGIELLDRLFDAADEAMDLPRCQDVLRAVQPEGRSLGSEIAAVLADRTAYLNARSLWLQDYYQSALFLPPPSLRERAAGLIDGKPSRVWQLAGQGGLGKTMQVRWLLARHWVPRPASIPCARVDYDAVDAVMCARYPFLTLVLVAEQLAPQLPRNPFSSLLRAYAPFLALARLGSPGRDDIDAVEARKANEAVPELFVEGCRAAGDRTIVVVLDTLEELSLRYPQETVELVRQLAAVAEKVKRLRLVFVGRYAIPAVRQSFPNVTDVQVAAFDRARADTYLEKVRGIADPERRRDLVSRAQGVPFVLALYADLVTHDPDVVLDEVHDRDPQLLYLVDRVIDRIREPVVRWLVRYGCVPRRLTLDYVREVLAPFVVRTASGDTSLDDPLLDTIREWYGRPLFRIDLGDLRARLEQGWRDLERYVSTSSWITPAPGEPSASTYVLKAEILAPLRAILADRLVLRELHSESARFYLAQAEGDRSRRARHMREAVYHLVQAGAEDLTQQWRGMVDVLREEGDHAGLGALCAEFLRSEYIDEQGRTRHRHDGQPLVPPSLAIEARLWLTYAVLARTLREGLSNQDLRWPELPWEPVPRRPAAGFIPMFDGLVTPAWVVAALDDPRRHQLILAAVDLVRASLALRRGEVELATAISQRWLQRAGDIGLTFGFVGVWAVRQAGGDEVDVLERVTKLALDYRRPADATLTCSALADQLVATGDVDGAVSWVRRTATATGQLWDRYLRLLTARGTPERAISRELPGEADQLARAAQQRARAEALLALRRPADALAALASSMDELNELVPDIRVRLREQAECLSLMGRVHGSLLSLDQAASSFEQATGLWRELGHPHGELRTVRHHAEVLLHEAGDVAGALRLLEQSRVDVGRPDESTGIRLLLAEARSRSGDIGESLALVDAVLNEGDRARPSYQRQAMAAIVGLIATGDVERFGPRLIEAIVKIQPPAAGLRLLEELRWSPARSHQGWRANSWRRSGPNRTAPRASTQCTTSSGRTVCARSPRTTSARYKTCWSGPSASRSPPSSRGRSSAPSAARHRSPRTTRRT